MDISNHYIYRKDFFRKIDQFTYSEEKYLAMS